MIRKWKPTCGERYYYISQSGTINSTVAGTGRDTIFRIANGNCYKKYGMCKHVLEILLDKLNLPQRGLGKIEMTHYMQGFGGIPEKYLPHPNSF